MPTTPDLTQRSRQPELMDAPDVAPDDLAHALRHLVIVNRWLNGYAPTLAGIRQLLPPGATTFTLLDVGCGTGDTLRYIARWARRRGLTPRLTGIELSDTTARLARAQCAAYPEIEIRHADLFALDEPFGIVHSALVLHHFSQDADATAALSKMQQLAQLGVIVNDLHRHTLAYHSIRLLTRALSRSFILQNDAPLSVARAFTRAELQSLATAAGATDIRISWHWAFRWLLILQKTDTPLRD